jgi:hypothetical protein
MERETEGARDAYRAYRRAFNGIVYGSEEPSAADSSMSGTAYGSRRPS